MTKRKRTQTTPRVVPTLTAEAEAVFSAISAPENAHIFTKEAARKAFAHLKRLSTDMTEPHQRTRSLLKTMRFLEELTRPGDTPRVPASVRETARQLLLHYPVFADIEAAHQALPGVFGPVEQRHAEGMSYTEPGNDPRR